MVYLVTDKKICHSVLITDMRVECVSEIFY